MELSDAIAESKRNPQTVHHIFAVMDIVVFGAGAMGSFFGGLLSRRNHVTLVCRRDHADAIRRAGLRITGKTSLVGHPDVATSLAGVKRADLVLVATKAYDTEAAARSLRRFARTATWLTLQNGLDNADVLARTATRVVAGVTSHGVTLLRPGEIRHAGIGDTAIGGFAGVNGPALVFLRDLFEEAGVPTRISPDIRRELWLKVIVNAGINPLAALTRLRNGYLVKSPALSAAVAGICAEAAMVAREEGFDITDREAADLAAKVARRTKENRASMLQDIERGRPTEIESITGAILRAAGRHGLRAPLNAQAYALVQGLERSSQLG
jgi:2-dehydropantoate 2-reductase